MFGWSPESSNPNEIMYVIGKISGYETNVKLVILTRMAS